MKNQGSPNSVRYAPPEGYYEQTVSRSPSKYLIQALELPNKASKTALDFGCGAGSDTKYLVEHGYNVTAVDGNPEAGDYIGRINGKGDAKFVLSNFEDFQFDSYGLVNSSRSLSFIHKNTFDDVLDRLLGSILPGGLFIGDFYGINDEWNKPDETMTFMSREDNEDLFKGMEVLSLDQVEGDGHIANGKAKHWHKFHIIARK